MTKVFGLIGGFILPVCLKLFGLSVSWLMVFLVPILVFIAYTTNLCIWEWIKKGVNGYPLKASAGYMMLQTIFILLQLGGVFSVSWWIIFWPTFLGVLLILLVLPIRLNSTLWNSITERINAKNPS